MWRQHQITLYFLGVLLSMLLIQGCDNSTSMEEMEREEGLDRQQICKLIGSREAESLVGMPLHISADEENPDHNSSCVWVNSENAPRLILNYHASVRGPVLSWLKANTGEGYELFSVPGGHGDIGVVYNKGDSTTNSAPGIFMVAVAKGEQLVTLSAPFLKAEKGSKAYNAWLELADNIAGRLGGGDIRD